MNGAIMTLARYHARKTIKRELLGQGLKLSHIEPREITRAANRYIEDHPEIVAFATQQYQLLLRVADCDPRELEGNQVNE